ncbi:hypothetical protein FB107DRAFT_215221 [Schizophyllum commune]
MALQLSELPNELLVAIFRACVSADSEWASKGTTSQTLPIIIQVCRLWRSLALDTSELWSDISVDLCDAQSYARARTYVLRSRDHSLAIHVNCVPESDEIPHLEFIAGLVPRITWLIIRGRAMSTVEQILATMEGAPLLRRLEYSVYQNDHPRQHEFWGLSEHPVVGLPVLRHLKAIRGCEQCAPRLAGLVSLNITHLPPLALANIIRDCPSLEALALPLYDPIVAASDAETPSLVEAPSIKRFAVDATDNLARGPCVPISLPNLEYLELSDDRGYSSEGYSQLFPPPKGAPKSTNPFPKLQTLHLHNGYDFERSLCMPFLRSLSTVRHLILTNPDTLPVSDKHWPGLQSMHVNTVLYTGEPRTGLFLTSEDLKAFAEARPAVEIIVPDHETVPVDLPFRRVPHGEYGLISADDVAEEDDGFYSDEMEGMFEIDHDFESEWDDYEDEDEEDDEDIYNDL